MHFFTIFIICYVYFQKKTIESLQDGPNNSQGDSFLGPKCTTPIQMGFSGVLMDGGNGGGQKASLPKICHTYPTMTKLGTVIPYLKKIRKIYESRDTPLEFC